LDLIEFNEVPFGGYYIIRNSVFI